MRGRGSNENPPNRFDRLHVVYDDMDPAERPAPATQFLQDPSRTIIARNDSPDVPFSASVNPYRGCEHGCSYCFARPTHEYLGFSAGLDFETKIVVKKDAAALLRRELSAPRWKPQVLAISGVTDPYQPIERKLEVTRQCLAVLVEFRNPVGIITKNHLVTRDIDLLSSLATHHAAAVFISITTLDADLAGKLEPRASRPEKRLEAISALARAGIPVGVMVAPVIPALTDHEMPHILEAAAAAGAKRAGKAILRLPYGVKEVFDAWLAEHVPLRHNHVIARVRDVRGGALYESEFGTRTAGRGIIADQLEAMFEVTCRRYGLNEDREELSTAAFRRPGPQQLALL